MIVTVNQKKLKEGLAIAEKIVFKNVSLPILHNLVIKTENGRAKISSTNLEIGINYWLGAKIEEDGEVAVPARIFSDFINNISDERVTISTKENIVSINSDNYKTKIIGFAAKDFPIIPKVKDLPLVKIPGSHLFDLMVSVIDAVALTDARPELAGVFLSFSSDRLDAAATDSFRLAERIINNKGTNDHAVILPRMTVQELIRIFSGSEDEVSVTVSENQIFFVSPNVELVSRLIDGRYPDYKKVIPDKFISRILVDRYELEKHIRLASIFSSNIADIKISGEEKGLKVSAKNPDRGEISSLVSGVLKNEPFETSVNYRYLLDGLKIIPTEKVILEFTGEGTPLVLRPENRKDVTYLIMPLRG